MIEIPESSTLAKQLNETVTGKRITHVCAGKSPHKFAFFSGEPEEYATRMKGRVIDQAEALAGQVQLSMGNLRLTFNDGTNLRFFEAGEKLPAKHQLLVEFEDGTALTCSVQMYGGIHLFKDGENDDFYYRVTQEKPSPLTEAFTLEYFLTIWKEAKPTLSIKALLATEQRIPGLGNGVLQDILFYAGVNPKSKINKLEEEKKTIYGSVKDTLRDMAAQRGRDTEKDLFGNPGGYKTQLSSKTWKEPCPICGGQIDRTAYLGGNVYYCLNCQPIKK